MPVLDGEKVADLQQAGANGQLAAWGAMRSCRNSRWIRRFEYGVGRRKLDSLANQLCVGSAQSPPSPEQREATHTSQQDDERLRDLLHSQQHPKRHQGNQRSWYVNDRSLS